MAFVPEIVHGDWHSVERAIRVICKKLGPASTPVFSSLTLSDLSASQFVMTDADKKLVTTNTLDMGNST